MGKTRRNIFFFPFWTSPSIGAKLRNNDVIHRVHNSWISIGRREERQRLEYGVNCRRRMDLNATKHFWRYISHVKRKTINYSSLTDDVNCNGKGDISFFFIPNAWMHAWRGFKLWFRFSSPTYSMREDWYSLFTINLKRSSLIRHWYPALTWLMSWENEILECALHYYNKTAKELSLLRIHVFLAK